MNTNFCDHGHGTWGEVRALPLGTGDGHGNVIVCHQHYLAELRRRRKIGWEDTGWEYPRWEDLTIYSSGE